MRQKMKAVPPVWAIVSVLVYAFLLIALVTPVVALLLDPHGDFSRVYLHWAYWLVIAIFIAGQIVLFAVPVRASKEPLVPRRSFLAAKVTVSLFVAVLFMATIWSVCVATWGDDALGPASWSPDAWGSALLALLLLLWAGWGYVFHRYSRDLDATTAVAKGLRWILKGSIVNLLVAVPSHIIVQRRDDCCAPGVTSLAIGTGIALMLLSFGPGTWFLYARRMARMRGDDGQEKR